MTSRRPGALRVVTSARAGPLRVVTFPRRGALRVVTSRRPGPLRWSLVPLGVATAVLTGDAWAFADRALADWRGQTVSSVVTVRVARVGQVPAPTVAVDAERPGPVIRWQPTSLSSGAPVHRYVVTRHTGGHSTVVCDVATTPVPTCVDASAPPGSALTYTVVATHGRYWTGQPSPPSRPVTTPAPVPAPTASDGMTDPSTAPTASAVPFPSLIPSTGAPTTTPVVPPTENATASPTPTDGLATSPRPPSQGPSGSLPPADGNGPGTAG